MFYLWIVLAFVGAGVLAASMTVIHGYAAPLLVELVGARRGGASGAEADEQAEEAEEGRRGFEEGAHRTYRGGHSDGPPVQSSSRAGRPRRK